MYKVIASGVVIIPETVMEGRRIKRVTPEVRISWRMGGITPKIDVTGMDYFLPMPSITA